MAAITQAVAPLADTTALTAYPSSSFTPVVGDLLVVGVWISDHVTQDATPMTSSAGITFTQARTELGQTSAGRVVVFVADSLVASAVAQTVTYNCVADAGTGAIVAPLRVSGMTRTGTAAIKQTAGAANVASGATPAATFSTAVLTTNACVGAIGGTGSNPISVTQPAGWTEYADVGYNTPASGMETCGRDSGETGTTITYGSTMFNVSGLVLVELDTSAAAAMGPDRPLRRFPLGV